MPMLVACKLVSHLEVAQGHQCGVVPTLLFQSEGRTQVPTEPEATPFAQALLLSLAHSGRNSTGVRGGYKVSLFCGVSSEKS